MTQKHRETDKVQMHEDTKKETPGEIQRDRDRKRQRWRERPGGMLMARISGPHSSPFKFQNVRVT